jgi:hypothetical protein
MTKKGESVEHGLSFFALSFEPEESEKVRHDLNDRPKHERNPFYGLGKTPLLCYGIGGYAEAFNEQQYRYDNDFRNRRVKRCS